ncbi:hypothetical protein K9L97_01435 [Candidatus Woesearchaeota archaeon]|nr:hypothetical protein [Candidatus Woesearchaeota archaeon]
MIYTLSESQKEILNSDKIEKYEPFMQMMHLFEMAQPVATIKLSIELLKGLSEQNANFFESFDNIPEKAKHNYELEVNDSEIIISVRIH